MTYSADVAEADPCDALVSHVSYLQLRTRIENVMI